MDLLSRICNFLMIRRRLEITRPWCVPFSFLFFSLFGTSFLFGITLESELRKKFIFFFFTILYLVILGDSSFSKILLSRVRYLFCLFDGVSSGCIHRLNGTGDCSFDRVYRVTMSAHMPARLRVSKHDEALLLFHVVGPRKNAHG